MGGTCTRGRRCRASGSSITPSAEADGSSPRPPAPDRMAERRRTILVTGGAGHVGSHVIELLLGDRRNRIISLDNYFNGSAENHIPGAEYREGHTKHVERLV